MSGSGRKAHSDVREWSVGPPEVLKWSGGIPGCSGVVGRPPRCPVVVGRPSWMSGIFGEALPYVRE